MTPQTISLEVQKGMGVQKNHLGPQNPQKIDFLGSKKWEKWFFSKNKTSGIWLNIGGGSHSGPGHPDSDRPHG